MKLAISSESACNKLKFNYQTHIKSIYIILLVFDWLIMDFFVLLIGVLHKYSRKYSSKDSDLKNYAHRTKAQTI